MNTRNLSRSLLLGISAAMLVLVMVQLLGCARDPAAYRWHANKSGWSTSLAVFRDGAYRIVITNVSNAPVRIFDDFSDASPFKGYGPLHFMVIDGRGKVLTVSDTTPDGWSTFSISASVGYGPTSPVFRYIRPNEQITVSGTLKDVLVGIKPDTPLVSWLGDKSLRISVRMGTGEEESTDITLLETPPFTLRSESPYPG